MTEHTPRSDPAPVTGNNNSSRLDADAGEGRRRLSDKEARQRTRNSWRGLRQRCRKRGSPYTYDPRWDSFEVFIDDVGLPAYEGDTLDRVPNTCTYYGKSTVRWADKRQQANNRSNTIFLTSNDGETLPLTVWAERTGQKPDTMRSHKRSDWSDQEIIDGKRRETPECSTGPSDHSTNKPWLEPPWEHWPRHWQEELKRRILASGAEHPWEYARNWLEERYNCLAKLGIQSVEEFRQQKEYWQRAREEIDEDEFQLDPLGQIILETTEEKFLQELAKKRRTIELNRQFLDEVNEVIKMRDDHARKKKEEKNERDLEKILKNSARTKGY